MCSNLCPFFYLYFRFFPIFLKSRIRNQILSKTFETVQIEIQLNFFLSLLNINLKTYQNIFWGFELLHFLQIESRLCYLDVLINVILYFNHFVKLLTLKGDIYVLSAVVAQYCPTK